MPLWKIMWTRFQKNAKTLEVLQQFYNKINDNKKSVDVFNDLLDICKPTDYNKQLHYILGKKRCYRNMRDYPLAIGELKNWLDIVERNNITNQYDNRDTFIYNELAELYFELEDYGNAEKYVSLSVDSDRSQSLKQKLEAKKAELTSEVAEETDDDGFDNDDDIIDEVVPEPEESLQSAYEEYIDVDGFDTLDKDDRDIIKTAFSFDENHLYCLLTYLNSASAISASSKKTRTDDNGETIYVGQAIKALDTAVAYAFNSPLVDLKYLSTEIIEAKISDQYLSSAEYIMGCILRGDVNAISDYSDEPFGYFAEFISEYATNSRAVRGASRNIADAIFEYSGKKDLEKALKVLTHNAFKETRGGANLLKNWIPKGGPANTELLDLLLTKLGFKPVSVSPDESVAFGEAYHVYCHKQIGRVNFVHNIPAFGSKSETEGFRVLCLYGNYNCDSLMDKFRSANSVAKHTLVLLDFALNIEERRRLARKIKEEKSFSKTFIVLDRVTLFYLAKHYAENTVFKRFLAVSLPFAYYQPFVEASTQDMPPELFTGRETELNSIESPEGANLVYGGRQLGKSALLKMAKRNIDRNGNGDRAVWIDIKDITASDALKVVCNKLILEDIIDKDSKCETWRDLAGHIQKRLNSEDPQKRINYFLLMLDEADTFIATSGETDDQPITALKNLPSERFKLVMAGLHNLSRYNRQSMHGNSNLIHLTSITVKQFRREEATKLLTSILAYLGFKFNQTIIDSILASTYNYPGLIQFYCQKLLEAMKNDDYAGYNESLTPTYEVTESHYKKVLSDKAFTNLVDQKFEATLFTEEKRHSNYHIIALIIAYLYYAEPNEKGYTESSIIKIAEEYHIKRVTSLEPEQLSEILSEMCDLNIITVLEGNYRFATDGFRKYLGNQEQIMDSINDYLEEATTI